MEAFLADIEKKAFHFAALATGSQDDALDLLQDSMIKLVTHYQAKPAHEWKPLLYKILQNKIRDYHRHQKVKNLIFFWKKDNDENEADFWLDASPETHNSCQQESQIISTQQQAEVMKQLKQLSANQQQCFLLRCWEGLSVAETAEIMQCSQGSVKTHYSRATDKLKVLLEASDDFQK